jgi:putative addiction module killer protein
MDLHEIDIGLYATRDGRVPFDEWLDSLNDSVAQQRVDTCLGRIRGGNLGDRKSLGGGLLEFHLDFGPGYRIYFTSQGRRVVILLVGGEKRGQDRDVQRAKEYLEDWKERTP